MTMIRVDPQELTASAGVIRNCAVELSDVSAQLAACVGCPMPPELTPVMTQLVQTIDQKLEQVALALNSEAADLNNRAALAGSDLAIASSAASPVTSLTSAVVASSSSVGIGMGFIGGHSSPSITIIDPMTGLAPSNSQMIIGGGITRRDSATGILNDAIRVHSDRAAALRNKILNNPASTRADIIIVGNSQIAHNENIARGLAASKTTMENRKGHLLTVGEYYQLVPEARPPAGSFI